jgi:hypothetical protein
MVFCGDTYVVYLGCVSAADRHAAHMPRYVARHAPGSAPEQTGAVGSDGNEPLAVGVRYPLVFCRVTNAATTNAYLPNP